MSSEKKFCDQFEKEDLVNAYRDLDVNGDGEVDCKDFSEVIHLFVFCFISPNKRPRDSDRSSERRGRIR